MPGEPDPQYVRARRVLLDAADAVGHLEPLFGSVDATGVAMAVRAAGPNAAPDTIAASLTALVSDLLSAL